SAYSNWLCRRWIRNVNVLCTFSRRSHATDTCRPVARSQISHLDLTAASQTQFGFDSVDNLLRRLSQLDRQRVLVQLWFVQIIKLTLQQFGIHKMTATTAYLLFDQCVVAAKKHELHFFAHAQTIAISSF